MKQIKIILNQISKIKPSFVYLSFLQHILKTLNIILFAFVPVIIIKFSTGAYKNPYILLYFCFALGLSLFLNDYLEKNNEKLSKTILTVFKNKFALKSIRLPYFMVEDMKTNMLRQKAEHALFNMNILSNIFSNLKKFANSFLIFISTIFILNISNYYLMLIYILILSPVVFLSIKRGKIEGEFALASVQNSWKTVYFIKEAIMPIHQMDFRIFKFNNLMQKNISRLTKNEKEIELAKQNKILKYDELIAFLKGLNTIIIMFSAFVLGGKNFNVELFTLIVMLIPRAVDSISDMVVSCAELKEECKQFQPVNDFLNLNEDITTNTNSSIDMSFDSLEFKNVSFTYPGNNRKTLKNVNFKINKNERISIVGPNLSGKSTIVKLICRFYIPDEGEILINDININEYSKDVYLNLISTIFQDFSFFPFTIGENISLKKEYDKNRILKYIEEVGLEDKISALNNELDTHINKALYPDATSFSGGQFQKLAMVRAMYKTSPIMIFDEPTSALDPIAESQIIKKFDEITKNKTVIFITHRMSTCSLSDKVLLLNMGEVENFLPHKEMLTKNKLYAELYDAQAKYFRDNN
ncbi:MAG: ABC transporter ATP-binding protein/permease [Ezakiella sp.]|nr:ABC transporter ATP-binding protein/permease [Ezakiella sp.]MDD7471220.1 ABC transporter ATP-binding protein [Bacillota bacterium]MDY3923357.1 ABC transporter ATP-binding protein [Ezakiella sp.]